MNIETINRLNAINHAFYATVADDFDQTRGTAWPGWQRLLPHLPMPLSVLDVGCGNGRFALFLHENLVPARQESPETAHSQLLVTACAADRATHYAANFPNGSSDSDSPLLTYHGVDSNRALLTHAQTALADKHDLSVQLEERDIIENTPDSGEYDLVVLLGVLHHIPGYARRQAFMRQLSTRVKPGGLLVFAAWRFYEYERFRERITAWPDDLQIEPNDYLLDWRRGEFSLRYCHYTDDAEHSALVAATGLTEIETYRADGLGGAANRYSILRRN